MVTNTNNNVKLNGNFNQTDDSFNILPYAHLLEPSPNKNGKFLCPSCGKNDFDYNRKTGKGLKCFSSVDNACHANKSYPIVKALKVKAGNWVEKNSNNSFTSVSNKVVTVDSVKVHKKVKAIRPANKTLRFYHDVINSTFKVCLNAVYENSTKQYCYQTAVDGTGKEIDFDKSGIDSKDVLPYCKQGFDNLVNENPGKIVIVESQSAARDCSIWFDKISLPVIAVYGGANKNLIPSLIEHLKLIPKATELIVIPDMDSKGFDYMMTLADKAIDAGYTVGLLKPYPDSPCWDILDNLPKGHEAVGPNDYLFESNLPAEEIIKRVTVLTKADLERMLTGKTVTVSNVASYAVSMDDVMFNDEIGLNWLVPGMIQEGASNMIVAYSNVGKSMLCSQLAIALTQGDNFLGHELPGDKKVLYHASDETISDLKVRLKTQGYITPNPNFKLFNEVEGSIWDVTNLESLDYELTYNDYDVIFIDSLSSIISNTDINENSPEIGKVLTKLIKLVCEKHCKTLVIVHHANRSILTANRLTLGNVCGHNSIARPVNQIIALRENTTEDGENVINLKAVKTRSSDKTELMIVRDDELKFQVVESINTPTVSTAETDNSNEKLIIDCLMQSDDWLTRDAIQGHTKLSKGFCNKLLLNLTNTGKVERAKLGKGYQYKINSNFTGSKDSDVYTKQEPEPEPMAETLDNSTVETLRLTDSENCEPIGEPVSEPVNNTINVQSEVIENSLPSENKDIVDTEKESKKDTKIVNGITFRTGDLYYQFKHKDTLIQIDSFPDGCDYAKCYKVAVDSTGSISRDSDNPGFILWLDKETYPYNGHQTSLL